MFTNKENQILIIYSPEVSYKQGIKSPSNDLWYGKKYKEFMFLKTYKSKRKEYDDFFNNIKKEIEQIENFPYYKVILNLENKYGKKINFCDLAMFNISEIVGIKNYIEPHGNLFKKICNNCKNIQKYELTTCDICNSLDLRPSLIHIEDDINYNSLISKINSSQYLFIVGNLDKRLNIDLFISEFKYVMLIGTNIKPDYNKNHNIEILEKLNDKSISEMYKKINIILSTEFKIDFNNPFKDKKNIFNRYMKKYQDEHMNYLIEDYTSSISIKIKEYYPFLSEYNGMLLESLWISYMNDTNRLSNFEDVYQEDFFIDMILIYIIYKWKNSKKFIIERPKFSLCKAFINEDKKLLELIKSTIMKNENIYTQ